MRSTFLTGIVLIVLGLSSSTVRGDMPRPFGRSDLNVRLRFENLDDYPRFDFYLKYGRSRGNPYSGRAYALRITLLSVCSSGCRKCSVVSWHFAGIECGLVKCLPGP